MRLLLLAEWAIPTNVPAVTTRPNHSTANLNGTMTVTNPVAHVTGAARAGRGIVEALRAGDLRMGDFWPQHC
jgi:hypothetical protein